jgi:hypothetical protein
MSLPPFSKLSTKKAHGLDGIPNGFLKTLTVNDNNVPLSAIQAIYNQILNLYTIAPEFQNHCILCNQAVALDSKEELAHLTVRCPQMSTIRNSSGVEAAIHSIQDTGIWNDISDCQIYYLLCGATVSTTVLWASGGPGVNSVPFKIRIIKFLQEGLWHYYTALSRVTGLRLPDQPG